MQKWILCTGPDWYRPSVTSTLQIANQFKAHGYKVLWVNPVAFKSPSLHSDTKTSRNKKILNKLSTHLRFFAKPKPNFYVVVPFYIPAFNPRWNKINSRLIGIQIKFILWLLGINIPNTILWISGSFTLSYMLRFPFKTKVYQAADVISSFKTDDTSVIKQLVEQEKHLCENADYIFASSPNIKQGIEKLSGKKTLLLTHGVDFSHFNKPHPLHPTIAAIKDKGLPIAGYYGTLMDTNDKDVFRALAEYGFSVIIIGKILGDYSMLQDLENIYFLGPIPYDELPPYSHGFDVCLLNWKLSKWIINSFPIKTLEYLAMGKPIVSCSIPIVKEIFGEVVYFADTPRQFVQKAVTAIKEDNSMLRNKRIEIARQQTWEKKYMYIEQIIG
jgi:glycosyltransferase involved in cell wall biosynthesis